jgi:hypothetical protein
VIFELERQPQRADGAAMRLALHLEPYPGEAGEVPMGEGLTGGPARVRLGRCLWVRASPGALPG